MFKKLLAGEFRPLIDYRRNLPPTLAAQATREGVQARANEMGFTIHALVPERYREEVLAPPVRDIARLAVDAALANHESLTVEQLLTALSQIVPWDDFLADFVEQCAESDEPAPGGASTTVFYDPSDVKNVPIPSRDEVWRRVCGSAVQWPRVRLRPPRGDAFGPNRSPRGPGTPPGTRKPGHGDRTLPCFLPAKYSNRRRGGIRTPGTSCEAQRFSSVFVN